MARHRSRSTKTPPKKLQRSKKAEKLPVSVDTFVSEVYLPHVKHRKQSWDVDERIARQHISPSFGDRLFTDIERAEVENWMQGLLNQGLARSTCNRILAVLKTICSLAVKHGQMTFAESPCLGVSSFKVQARRERYLSLEEAQRLVQELSISDRQEGQVILLLLFTGARKNEILKARWENVHLEQNLLTVPVSKSGKPRHIHLSAEARAIIEAISRIPGNPWLFPGKKPGKPLSDIYLFWNPLRHKLGLADVRIHDLRHTYASFLANAGESLYKVQNLLGHSDPRTTMRYAHLGQASLQAATQMVSTWLVSGKRHDREETSALPLYGVLAGANRASPVVAQSV